MRESMQNKRYIRIGLVISLIFFCGIGNAISNPENNTDNLRQSGINYSSHNQTLSPVDEPATASTLVIPGRPSVESDMFRILNVTANMILQFDECTTFDLDAGDERIVKIVFYRRMHIGTISYTVSNTPLNVTVVPSEFFATNKYEYPAIITVRADSNLSSGNYSFILEAEGAIGTETYSREFFVNVKNAREETVFYQRVSVTIVLLLSSLVIVVLYYRRSKKRY